MKRRRLTGVRNVRGALVLLGCMGILPGCAVQPHQMPAASAATSVPNSISTAAMQPKSTARAVSPAHAAAVASGGKKAPTGPAAAMAKAAAPAAARIPPPPPIARQGDAWQALPGAIYAVSNEIPATSTTAPAVVVAAPRVEAETPVLQPVALRQPALLAERGPLLSAAAFGDAEAQAVRYAGGRCTDRIYRMAWAAADLVHVQPAFVAALIEAESGCNSEAVSVAGARGLMQLLPQAGAREGYRYLHGADHRPTLKELRDPATNIQLGVAYLGALQGHFYFVQSAAARLVLMIAAYNCGPDFIDQRLPAAAIGWSAEEAARWVARRTPAETRAFVVAVTEKAALYGSAVEAVRGGGVGKKNLSP